MTRIEMLNYCIKNDIDPMNVLFDPFEDIQFQLGVKRMIGEKDTPVDLQELREGEYVEAIKQK